MVRCQVRHSRSCLQGPGTFLGLTAGALVLPAELRGLPNRHLLVGSVQSQPFDPELVRQH